MESLKIFGESSRVPGMNDKIRQVRKNIAEYVKVHPNQSELVADFDLALKTVDVNNPTELLDFLTQWNKASWLQKISEYQKASLLSGLSTQGVNALGNALHQAMDIPVRFLALSLIHISEPTRPY